MIIAGDIGGTKTVMALIDRASGSRHLIRERRYSSSEYAALADIVEDFLSDVELPPIAACFGVAGPVDDNRVRVTNLPWEIDGLKLSEVIGGKPVWLLNDLEAIANAIPTLDASDLEIVKLGTRERFEPVAVIAPGTGLGEAFLFWDGQRYRAIPSEGGHTDFAPASPLELELLAYLQPRLGHVSYERVCSGIGIPNIYAFMKDSGKYDEPAWLQEALLEVDDKTPVIVKMAQTKAASICEATFDLFLSILGSEAGNLVLQVLATGGVYLGGGIPPRICPDLRGEAFVSAFTQKGRFSDLLSQVPVYVIMNPKAAIYGAANVGLINAYSG